MSGLCSAHQGTCPDECPIQYRTLRAALEAIAFDVRQVAGSGGDRGELIERLLVHLDAALRSTSAPPEKKT